MKKTNQLTLLVLTFFMSFIVSCEKHKCKCEHEDKDFEIPEGTFCYVDEGRTGEMLNYDEVVAMLTDYDQTREAPLEKALGYKDARINIFEFSKFKKYLGHIEAQSKKAKIKITGISFIYASKKNYNGTNKSYQSLLYIPTTTINGKQVQFDPVQSAKQGKLVTFKDMLAGYNYNWQYGKNDADKNNENKLTLKSKAQLKNQPSGAGNFGTSRPPY